MAINLGTVRPGSTVYIPYDTFDGGTGASITQTGLAVTDIEVYKDGSVTQRASDNGYTLLDTDGIDFDGLTGIHGFSISLADNSTAGFWAAGSRYFVVVSSVTVDAQTVSFVAAYFDIGYPDAILNTTIASLSSQTSFTLTVGPAEDDALNGSIVCIHDVASAVQLGYAVILDYTGSTKTVTLAAGTTFTAAATDNIAVFPPSNVTHAAAVAWNSGAIGATTLASDTIAAAKIATGAITSAKFAAGAIDAAAIATDAIGAAELADGAITAATFAAGAIDATAIASDAIAAAKIAAGAITSAKFAAGAIDAAAIATDAIGAAELADGAITAATFAAGAIDATAIANGAIDAATFAAGAITAAVIATDAIDADALAADAIAEINATVDTALADYDPPTRTEATADKAEILNILQGLVIEQGTIGATGNDTTHVHLTGFSYGDDEINGYLLVIFDVSTSEYHHREITDYVGATDLATVATLPFTPENSVDTYWLLGTLGSASLTGGDATQAKQDLLIAAVITNAAGADIAADIIAIKAETAAIVDDTGTSGVVLANDAITSAKIAANAIGSSEIADGAITSAKFAAGAITATVIATDAIDNDAIAANAVTEIQSGLATTTHVQEVEDKIDIIDTNVDDIETVVITNAAGVDIAADIIAIKAQTVAIEADTTNLPSDPADASVIAGRFDTLDTSIADLPTNAELATSQAAADDATLAAIAALNNLSAAQVNAEVDTALSDYDPPTRAELTTDTNSVLSAVGDVPTNAELTTALAAADDAVLAALSTAQTAIIDGVLDGVRLSKNTAFSNFMFKMVDATDHVTPETGLTITATRSLDGAAFGACANSATEVASGWYKIDLAAGDLNANIVVLKFSGTGADATEVVIVTQPAD
jgi:hypothetical protein